MQLNLHKYTLSHHRRTWGEYCRKLVPCRCTATLHKARRITESQSGITRCVELCQMRQWHRCYCQRDLACRLNSPPSCAPECLHADSNSACKITRYLTPTSISAGIKPNNTQRRKSSTGVTFKRDTFPLKNFLCCRACKGSRPPRNFLTPSCGGVPPG